MNETEKFIFYVIKCAIFDKRDNPSNTVEKQKIFDLYDSLIDNYFDEITDDINQNMKISKNTIPSKEDFKNRFFDTVFK